MKQITYCAPAKVILSGEHAVVYGKPALVSTADLRLRFTVTTLMRPHESCTNLTILFISNKVKEYLEKNRIKYKNKHFNVQIESDIPIGRGLGSSAALSVAAVSSFLRFYTEKEFEKTVINNLAYQVEKHFHKNPSGVDNSASCFGGLIYYRREFEFLKNMAVLNFKIPQKIEEKLFLIDSGQSLESTAQMVESVGKMYNKKPALVEQILNDIEKVTKRMTVAIVKEDINFFQQCLLDNQIFLEMLGVVSMRTKTMLKNLSQYGVGKVTGAGGKIGGSGFLLFITNNQSGLERYLKKEKINYYKFHQDDKGLIDED
jgi:mevalonate kinase